MYRVRIELEHAESAVVQELDPRGQHHICGVPNHPTPPATLSVALQWLGLISGIAHSKGTALCTRCSVERTTAGKNGTAGTIYRSPVAINGGGVPATPGSHVPLTRHVGAHAEEDTRAQLERTAQPALPAHVMSASARDGSGGRSQQVARQMEGREDW